MTARRRQDGFELARIEPPVVRFALGREEHEPDRS